MIPIALDAMGGDRAPAETVAGAVLAAADGVDVVLVGDEEILKRELAALSASLPIVHAPESIDMGDDPARALREKPESSISVAARLVRDGSAGAFVSAGSTGAAMAAAAILIGRAPGVLRPTIASIIPTPGSPTLILDSGANLDVKAEHLIQFAVMGSVAAEVFFGMTAAPGRACSTTAKSRGRGEPSRRKCTGLLANAPVNFIGNVEGRDIGANRADVFVTDGFVGNITLKIDRGGRLDGHRHGPRSLRVARRRGPYSRRSRRSHRFGGSSTTSTPAGPTSSGSTGWSSSPTVPPPGSPWPTPCARRGTESQRDLVGKMTARLAQT